MQDLGQLGMGDPELPAPDRRHTSDGRVLEHIAQRISANHTAGADDARMRFTAVTTERAPPSSRRRAGAPQTATRRPLYERVARSGGAAIIRLRFRAIDREVMRHA